MTLYEPRQVAHFMRRADNRGYQDEWSGLPMTTRQIARAAVGAAYRPAGMTDDVAVSYFKTAYLAGQDRARMEQGEAAYGFIEAAKAAVRSMLAA